MSDYVKIKSIRLPFPKNLIDKLEVDDCWDCEEYLKETLGDLWYTYNNKKVLTLNAPTAHIIEYGFSFLLNDDDRNKFLPLFDKIGIEYNVEDLRKVVYCYYNGCEAPDYYEVSEPNFDNL